MGRGALESFPNIKTNSLCNRSNTGQAQKKACPAFFSAFVSQSKSRRQIAVEVSDPIPISAGNGRVCYVLSAPESEFAPHFLNGRRGVWVRTDEFSSRSMSHHFVASIKRHQPRQLP